jgi:hypothetical protein
MARVTKGVAARLRGERRRTAAEGGLSARMQIDHSVTAITSRRSPCGHTARGAGKSGEEGMIIARSGAKAPKTPAGTVLAWLPPPSALRRGADGSATILPLSGWAICDGTKGTPNLSNRFIIDGLRNEGFGSSAGSATHSDDASVPPARTSRAGGELTSARHNRGVTTDPSDSSPALVTLIYIMKL